MFTGIIEETGTVQAATTEADGRRLRIETGLEGLTRGQSISVSGACLTVESHGDGWFEVFLAAETVDRTYLGNAEPGTVVNIERALPADGRLDGHMVQGHVDATATVRTVEQLDEDWVFGFDLPTGVGQYVVEKGSISVDGVSLTVAEKDASKETFTTAIIPETYAVTNLSAKAPGDPVHLEVDVIAKYVESLIEGYTSTTQR
ncbi:MAG: riboflavin synthase, alpha subunit [halophilic archaeon J07HX5]|jgi:riboflavin synthase, alpha subunit|nr:MAG: riboflavin synthase, alpha subunit [halophilic archaeon J07HX5]